MNKNRIFDSQAKISEALTWLHRELRHIRFIHSSFVVISALTLVFAIIAPSLDKKLLAEINLLIPFVHNLTKKENLSPDQIEKIIPTIEDCPETYIDPFINAIPDDQTTKIIPIEFPQDIKKMKLEYIRELDEKPLFTITQIKKIRLELGALEKYRVWISNCAEKQLRSDPMKARILEAAESEEYNQSRITFSQGSFAYIEVPRFPHEYDLPRRPMFLQFPKYLKVNTGVPYSSTGTITFIEKEVPFPANWFESNFPIIVDGWDVFHNKTIEEIESEVLSRKYKRSPPIELPWGMRIPSEYSHNILPILMSLFILYLWLEVSYAAQFAKFCKDNCTYSPIFYSPWLGGRRGILRVVLLISTLCFLPLSSLLYLAYKFALFGNVETYIYLLILTISGIFIWIISENISDITFPLVKMTYLRKILPKKG